MALILYGSVTSPYVRRIRLFMEGMDYQFEPINIFDEKNREEFRQISPIKKLPVLMDDEHVVFDSHTIYQYLSKLKKLPAATLQEANLISVIDALTDSNIILLLSARSGLNTEEDKLIFNLQHERIPECLNWLEERAQAGGFATWSFASMCLLASIEWLEFRGLCDVTPYPSLKLACADLADKPEAIATRPVS